MKTNIRNLSAVQKQTQTYPTTCDSKDTAMHIKAPLAKRLRIGSDCTGYNATALAQESLQIPYANVFACDKDAKVRKVLAKNFKDLRDDADGDGNIWADCTSRDVSRMPAVQLYTAGFPCQPFSSAGARRGARDPHGKSVVQGVLGYIREKRPMVFVLENVRGLIQHHHSFFEWILLQIDGIRTSVGTPYYQVDWEILNTKDHGAPQNRERVFIAGLSSQHIKKEFDWPRRIPMPDLVTFLEPFDARLARDPKLPRSITALSNYLKLVTKIKGEGGVLGVDSEPWVGDLGRSQQWGATLNYNYIPRITASRAASGGYWLFNRGRYWG
jgi:site-specific DNA-cytosine methylase